MKRLVNMYLVLGTCLNVLDLWLIGFKNVRYKSHYSYLQLCSKFFALGVMYLHGYMAITLNN